MRLNSAIAAIIMALAGCAEPVAIEQPGPDHPANPLAGASPAPEPSRTLIINRGLSPASAPSTTAPAALYACPMHPEVTSPDPQARCPRCKMKINKPVKPATAPADAPARGHQHHQHGAH